MKIGIINGPNLNLTGIREKSIYGTKTFDDLLTELVVAYPNVDISYYQSNIEGEIINKLHDWGFNMDGIILNAGAYTHTSIAIGDAVKAIKTPVIEVHMSNVFNREDFRHVSYIAPNARGLISGFGLCSYRLAMESFL